MLSGLKIIKRSSGKIFSDSLYYNSLFLILATGSMAVFGFIFWLINSKLFAAEDLGIATTLIPTANIIALISLFGLDASLIRFLATNPNSKIVVRSSLLVVALCSSIFGFAFGITVHFHSPTLSHFFDNYIHYLVFITLIASTALNLICDAVYLTHKKSILTLVVTTFYSFLKSLFPLLFIGFGAAGILIAAAAAQCIGLIINFYILQKKWQYFSNFVISLQALTKTWKYTVSNYIGNIFSLLPASLIPLLIINKIGSAEAAYYYIVMMIVNLLYVVSYATTKSLFAEGSNTSESLVMKIRKTVIFIFSITVPAIILLWFSADMILDLFGTNYSENGSNLLKLAGLTALPLSVYAICMSIFRIQKQSLLLILSNLMFVSLVISLTLYFMKDGLFGVGLAWLIAHSISALIAVCLVIVSLKNKVYR